MASISSNSNESNSDYEFLMQRLHISGTNHNHNTGGGGGINSNSIQRSQRQQQPQQSHHEDYRMYERTNITAASKYATPKQIEQLHLQQYSPRSNTSLDINGGGSAYTGNGSHSPVYENLDFYQSSAGVSMPKHFESVSKRAQPQSPASMGQPQVIQRGHYMVMQPPPPGAAISSLRYAHTPVPDPDSTPIYENVNMRVIPNTGQQRAQPQASPATATIYQHHNIDAVLSSPQHHSNLATRLQQQQHHHQQQSSLELADNQSNNLAVNTLDLLASPMHRRSTSNSSLKSAAQPQQSMGGALTCEPNSPTQRYRNLSLPSSHINTIPISPSKSYASSSSSMSGPNDYKLLQHTPLKTTVRICYNLAYNIHWS